MLQLQQLKWKQGLLIVDEHPVEVAEKQSGVFKGEETKAQEKAMQRIRTGVVVAEGFQYEDQLHLFSKNRTTLDGSLKTFVGQTILYGAEAVEPLDIQLEGVKRPIAIQSNYLFALIDESTGSPY